jgi:hypothetical protein
MDNGIGSATFGSILEYIRKAIQFKAIGLFGFVGEFLKLKFIEDFSVVP